MRANRPKPKRPQAKFDIDSLLNMVEKKFCEKKTCSKRYLTITYIGYYDEKSNSILVSYKINCYLILCINNTIINIFNQLYFQ